MTKTNLEKIKLHTPRLYLQPFQHGFGELIYEAVMETYELLAPWKIWILNEKEKLSSQDYEQFGNKKIELLKECKDLTLLVFESSSNKLIGAVSINKIDMEKSHGFLGFWIRQSCIKQGYAQEAADCLIHFAFDTLKLSHINAVHEHGNVQSEKTLLKLGFTLSTEINCDHSPNWIYYFKNNPIINLTYKD